MDITRPLLDTLQFADVWLESSEAKAHSTLLSQDCGVGNAFQEGGMGGWMVDVCERSGWVFIIYAIFVAFYFCPAHFLLYDIGL